MKPNTCRDVTQKFRFENLPPETRTKHDAVLSGQTNRSCLSSAHCSIIVLFQMIQFCYVWGQSRSFITELSSEQNYQRDFLLSKLSSVIHCSYLSNL